MDKRITVDNGKLGMLVEDARAAEELMWLQIITWSTQKLISGFSKSKCRKMKVEKACTQQGSTDPYTEKRFNH